MSITNTYMFHHQGGYAMQPVGKFFLTKVLIFITLAWLPGYVAAQAFDGYTLYGTFGSNTTRLVNMNNTIVKSWTHTRSGGYSAYLLQDGSVLRTAVSSSSSLNGGGAQGVVQRVSWSGSLLWEYTYSTTTYRAHHDIEPMPNGNVLIIAWEVKTGAQAVAAGMNHSATIWPDHIIEVQPVGSTGGNIVWRWHAWDHLIQDFDPTKANYGVVADHPELLDINYRSTSGDWMHVNGISYNPELDQIVFSSHELDEIYVIDHSTTIAEAAGHTGGRWGKGGDFLYRWGNPAAYRAPGATVFNVVHCAAWVPDTLPGGGHLMAFNNRNGTGASMIVELVPPVDTAGNYIWTPGAAFGPSSPVWSYSASGFYSNHLGGVQRLPNGNTLIAQSTSGRVFETTSAGTVVWNYQPGGQIVRALRYAPNYPGILITDVDEKGNTPPLQFELSQNYPNPFNPATTITFSVPRETFVLLEVFNMIGERVATLVSDRKPAGMHSAVFDASEHSSGIYFYRMSTEHFVSARKLVVLK
ncbi:MAG: aryl-sulfate sulfotransferase [Bacteroidetes bacterium]|nr:aryl-sulfate sulfotransferase [Bacteroidota bacterium]MCW5896463.1 aryl-sulfate sulfotransferase [Bacteroidota bacterium]